MSPDGTGGAGMRLVGDRGPAPQQGARVMAASGRAITIVGRAVEGGVPMAGPDEDECQAYAEREDMLCMRPDGHPGPHYDPFDRVLWELAGEVPA